jgi:hypothetical protein
VHAELHADRQRRVDDASRREQHALLVVAGDLRGAGGQDQLAAVRVDVGGEQGDVLRVGRGLDRAQQPVERLRRGVDAFAGDQGVGPLEAQERDRHRPVLGRPAAGEDVRAHGQRQARGDGVGVKHRACAARQDLAPDRAIGEQHAGALARAERLGRQPRGRFGREQDLARGRLGLHRAKARPARPGGQQLGVRRADREERERAAVHALRHLQHDLGAGQRDAAHARELVAHRERRAARALEVALAGVPQQQRVAAELEQAPAGVVGDRQDRAERAADEVGDLLGALAALRRQLLGQLGEPRNVDEDRGPLGAPAARAVAGGEALLQDARDVEREPRRAGGGRQGLLGRAGFDHRGGGGRRAMINRSAGLSSPPCASDRS